MKRLAVWALALLTVLTACTQIPTSSEVVAVDPSDVISETTVDFLPPGPSDGASPEEILRGFIAAGTAAQNNYRVARSYLTEEFRDVWNPTQSVLISGGEGAIGQLEDGQWQYSTTVVASVDEAGRYDALGQRTSQDLVFRLVEESGQWRIGEGPDGIVLGELAFRESFESVRLYYYSADYRELVPDVRWFASRGDVLTKVIRGLLEPPSYWLNQGATVSAFPPGTQLVLAPVPVVEGQARVDLSDGVLEADETQRERMLWQLETTLTQISDVADVVVTVNQIPVGIPRDEANQPVLTSGRDPRPLVVRGSDFGYVQSGRIEGIEALEQNLVSLRPERVFYSAGFSEAAVVGEQGLWRVGEGPLDEEPLDSREGLIRPIIDSCGYLWSLTATPGEGALLVFPRPLGAERPEPIELNLELPVGSEVVSMELARDNTRLLLLVQGESAVRVLLAGVQRSAECTPVGLGEFLELSPLDNVAVDAAFVDETQVAIVTREDSVGQVVIQDVSGLVFSAGRPADPVTLVGGVGGIAGLRLLTEQGVLYQPRGNGWQPTGERANVLVTQR